MQQTIRLEYNYGMTFFGQDWRWSHFESLCPKRLDFGAKKNYDAIETLEYNTIFWHQMKIFALS